MWIETASGRPSRVPFSRLAGSIGTRRCSRAQWRPRQDFVRIAIGFVPARILAKLGIGRMGRLVDGTSLEKPFKLRIDELMGRGSERLNGPWSRMVIPDLQWEGSAEKPLLRHFEFLSPLGLQRRCGLPLLRGAACGISFTHKGTCKRVPYFDRREKSVA